MSADRLLTGQPLAKQSDERAKAHTAALDQTTVARVRVDGKMEYAVGLSKEDAVWLKGFLSVYLGPASLRIQKKMVWVIEQNAKGMDEHL